MESEEGVDVRVEGAVEGDAIFGKKRSPCFWRGVVVVEVQGDVEGVADEGAFFRR